ncbi:MAG: leucine-rich repeat protein [Candidatus Paceibacterota bacterium]
MKISKFFNSFFPSAIGRKLKKIKQKGLRAFTLIELLIVIAIVAILAAVIIVGTVGAQASARDAGRLSDLSQTKKSLQAYYLAYNGYPTTGNDGISLEDNATFTQTMKNSGYMSTVPRDPKYTASAGEYTYKYISTTSNAFTLCAKSEAKSGNYFCATQDSGGVSQTSSAPVFGVWGGGETGGEPQDYDMIHTLTFNEASGTCNIRLYRGSFSAYTGTVYYRAGTSGEWTELNVSGTATTFPVLATTMQIGHDNNKSGNDYMTVSFYGQSTNLTGIAISQKAAFSGTMGNYFMASYAYGCSSLTSLAVPDTSGLTSVGDAFMYVYAYNCTALTSLSVPDTSGLTSVGNHFMFVYAYGCTSLTSLSVPDTSGLTSVGNYFMGVYAYGCSALTSLAVPDTSGVTSVGVNFMENYADGCTSLTSLAIPDTSSLTSAGNYFMYCYAYDCTALTRLELPAAGWFTAHNIDWSVPSGRLNYLKGYVKTSDDKTAWQALTASGKTLYTNYVRSSDNVILE